MLKVDSIGLQISQVADGLLISQVTEDIKYSYLARNWRLDGNPGAIATEFVETCLRHGLTAALQHNHPQQHRRGDGTGVDYLSFAKDYKSRWICAIDSVTQTSRTVAIWKGHKVTLDSHGIDYVMETGRGRNPRITFELLDNALSVITLHGYSQ